MNSEQDRSWIEYSGKPSRRSYFIKKAIRWGGRYLRKKSLIETRRLWESSAGRLKIPMGYEVKDVEIAGVKCEWILPEAAPGKKTVIYLHGGGYVLGSLATARGLGLLLSRYSGERVLCVDYRLAPENTFPAGLEDSLTVYRSLLSQGVAPGDVIFVGDSAGGGLSLATVLALKDRGEDLPGAVICLSPWTDLAATGKSNRENARLDPIFGGGPGVIRAEDYAEGESLYNPLVSPLYGDYKDYPPLLIHVGTDEVILDDSVRLAERAREAGTEVHLKIWKGMWHVFASQHNVLPEARQSLKEIGEFIKGI